MAEPPAKKFKPLSAAYAGKGFFFSRGPGTFRVPESLHEEIRARFAVRFTEVCKQAGASTDGVALFRSGVSAVRNDTDHEELFRQESYFNYLFGVMEPDNWGMIELPSGRSTLFIPRLDKAYAIWMGEIKTPAFFKDKYGVDEVRYTDEVQKSVSDYLASKPGSALHTLSGTNSDSGRNIAEILSTSAGVPNGTEPREDLLFNALAECRVLKTEKELALMQYVSWVTSIAHVNVMREVKPGMMEYNLESRFMFHIAELGCRFSAYTNICACGPNSAVLHYGHAGAPNDRQLLEDDIAMLDMGAEYHCYCSDVSCSYPVSGKFSPKQRIIFDTVLDAQRRIYKEMRDGTAWTDMHKLMWRVLCEHMTRAGLLRGDVEKMIEAEIGAVFCPAGLGHLIGLDTHDVGGYLPGQPLRIDKAGIRKLRTARVLQAGMCLTVEPGCYFIDVLLDDALANPLQAKFFVPEVVASYRGIGGMRLEDVVVITKTGIENYTLCPRTIEEVESVMAGGQWPPEKDAAPDLYRQWVTLDKEHGAMVSAPLAQKQ